jgi:hypothetical protein
LDEGKQMINIKCKNCIWCKLEGTKYFLFSYNYYICSHNKHIFPMDISAVNLDLNNRINKNNNHDCDEYKGK